MRRNGPLPFAVCSLLVFCTSLWADDWQPSSGSILLTSHTNWQTHVDPRGPAKSNTAWPGNPWAVSSCEAGLLSEKRTYFGAGIALLRPHVGTIAADFEPDTDGPWVSDDVIDLVDYGDADYLEYLGQGYVVMLDALKAEGLILDYGVMMKTTGHVSDGDVVIWWSIKSLADYE